MNGKESGPENTEPAWFRTWREKQERLRAEYEEKNRVDDSFLEQSVADLLVEDKDFDRRKKEFLQPHNAKLLNRCRDCGDSQRLVTLYLFQLYHYYAGLGRVHAAAAWQRHTFAISMWVVAFTFFTQFLVGGSREIYLPALSVVFLLLGAYLGYYHGIKAWWASVSSLRRSDKLYLAVFIAVGIMLIGVMLFAWASNGNGRMSDSGLVLTVTSCLTVIIATASFALKNMKKADTT